MKPKGTPLRQMRLQDEITELKRTITLQQRRVDLLVSERNDLERLYVNLKDNYANLAQLKVNRIIEAIVHVDNLGLRE